MGIATAKAETTTKAGLPHTNTPLNSTLLTWQHDIRSLAHRKHVDDSTYVKYIQSTYSI